MTTLGPLVPADETFHHQIADTFATVSQSDRSWTEKVCAMAARKDGTIGLGVRHGEVHEPRRARCVRRREPRDGAVDRALESPSRARRRAPRDRSDPLRGARAAASWCGSRSRPTTWCRSASSGRSPGRCRVRSRTRSTTGRRDGLRLDADIVRYHQIGTAAGWVEVDGERHELDDATSVSTRDHSWGVRYQVGAPVADVEDAPRPTSVSTTVIWSPMLLERADGTRYGLHLYYQRHGVAGWERVELQGGIEHPDGQREPFVALVARPRRARRQPAPAVGRARLHHGRRIGPAAADHRAGRHRVPPRHRALLRVRRPLAR